MHQWFHLRKLEVGLIVTQRSTVLRRRISPMGEVQLRAEGLAGEHGSGAGSGSVRLARPSLKRLDGNTIHHGHHMGHLSL